MRAFSLLELTIVVAIAAAVAAGAVVGISSAARRAAADDELKRLLHDVSAQRAAHVAAGRTAHLVVCVDCFDGNGGPNTSPRADTIDVAVADGQLLLQQRYDLRFADACDGIELNALGRSVTAAGRPRECTLSIDTGDVKPQSLTFAADGRLQPSFAPALLAEPAHAQNLSSRTTPVPMNRGRFTGDATRATELQLR